MIELELTSGGVAVRAGLAKLTPSICLVVAACGVSACSGKGQAASAATSGGALGGALAPTQETGTTGAAAGVSGGATAGTTSGQPAGPTFTTIYGSIIVGSGCIAGPTCHASDAGGKLTMLEQGKAYAGLVGVVAMGMNMTAGATNCADTGLLRVKPGDPDNSLLVKKLEGNPPCGMPMPVGGMLKPDQIMQIRTWIQNGANDD